MVCKDNGLLCWGPRFESYRHPGCQIFYPFITSNASCLLSAYHNKMVNKSPGKNDLRIMPCTSALEKEQLNLQTVTYRESRTTLNFKKYLCISCSALFILLFCSLEHFAMFLWLFKRKRLIHVWYLKCKFSKMILFFSFQVCNEVFRQKTNKNETRGNISIKWEDNVISCEHRSKYISFSLISLMKKKFYLV